MLMVSLEGGNAGGEWTDYVCHTRCSQLRALSFIDSRFSIAIGLLAVSHPPAEVDTDPQRPHSALLLHCTLEVIPCTRVPSLSLLHHRPARASPRIFHWRSARCRPSASSALLFPRPRSLALILLAQPLRCPSDKP
ncbi:hypothetical protein B0H13DRAFT_2366408 [Mycena leptocephala]|nr:hypothetical protein B0H13DRAFT_2366408 [Mycena leptocephala]